MGFENFTVQSNDFESDESDGVENWLVQTEPEKIIRDMEEQLKKFQSECAKLDKEFELDENIVKILQDKIRGAKEFMNGLAHSVSRYKENPNSKTAMKSAVDSFNAEYQRCREEIKPQILWRIREQHEGAQG